MSTHGFRAFESTSRLGAREQTDEERYGIPENFLEIEVKNPQTHGMTHDALSLRTIAVRVSSRLQNSHYNFNYLL